ncbi:hypothetical protein PO856_002498 [Pectobacterium brasiliense]|uniref:hypothetical protein n=1 Tax=Pectobacterium brasiliense TaxID=180957 RepID=UPI00240741EE|nr:hypothetical protein [Pectobacterium brasiliense]MDG0805267.1 hypothetical protein [Pectobacterium brasiliense]
MADNISPSQYVSRMLNIEEDDRLNELKDIIFELDINIRLRKITQNQKYEVIYEIKRAIENVSGVSLSEKNSPFDVIKRGGNSASNDDLVELISMLNKGRSQ